MNARVAIGCLALLAASCAPLAPTFAPPPITTGDELYAIDPSHTFPYFEVSHMGWSTHRGRFDKTRGWVVLNRVAHTGSIDLVIDADSIDTGDPTLEQRLREEDFFNTAAYPAIAFKSNKLRFEGDTPVAIDGELSLRGVTRPLTLAVTSFRCGKLPLIGREVCGANAEARIQRADFGISVYSSMVGGEIKLLIQIEAHKR